MLKPVNIAKFKKKASLNNRYSKQLQRLRSQNIQTNCIETAVKRAVANLAKTKTASLVIYGEPQSGKTEMMICLSHWIKRSNIGSCALTVYLDADACPVKQEIYRVAARPRTRPPILSNL